MARQTYIYSRLIYRYICPSFSDISNFELSISTVVNKFPCSKGIVHRPRYDLCVGWTVKPYLLACSYSLPSTMCHLCNVLMPAIHIRVFLIILVLKNFLNAFIQLLCVRCVFSVTCSAACCGSVILFLVFFYFSVNVYF